MLLRNNIPITYIFGKIKKELLYVVLYSVGVVILYQNFHITRISIPIAVPALLGTIISLLLAFRSNQAYDRWWEARILWGAIVNDSRTFIRQLIHLLPNDDRKAQYVKDFAIRQSMWCYALGYRLRKESFPSFLSAYLERENITGDHLPNALLSRHAADLAAVSTEFELNANIQVQLETTLQRLTDAMG
ncbi:MAG: hypothetical protein EOO92_26725, partial [Pedobacter sp.]